MFFGFGSKETAFGTPAVTLSEPVEHVRGEHWKTDVPVGFRNPWPSAKGEQVGGGGGEWWDQR